MFIRYGSLDLPLLTIEEWIKENVFSEDGLEYIYSHEKITVNTYINLDTVNGAVLNITQFTGRGNNSDGTSNENSNDNAVKPPNNTDNLSLVLAYLNQPRRPLLVYQNSEPGKPDQANILLKSPPINGTLCDAKTGPLCRLIQVQPVGGQSTVALRLQFETWIPRCNPVASQAKVVLSNTWSYRLSFTENYYAQRIIEGEAVFRKDIMLFSGLTVARLTPDLFFPVPIGFKREVPNMQLSQDGTTLTYQLVDIQQAMNAPGLIQFGITSVSVDEQRSYSAPSAASKLLSVAALGLIG